MTASRPVHVLILGAASGIAKATARIYASEGAVIGLAGRDAARLAAIADDVNVRGASRVETFKIDFTTADATTSLNVMIDRLGPIDHIILAYGLLGDQARSEQEISLAQQIIAVNFGSAALWCLASASVMEKQGSGSLVVLGSVAGDRGRRSNYIYGAAKSGLATLVQGISHRFANKGPRAVIVKPGPTDTAMTAGMKKGGPMWATPEAVAAIVRKAADNGGPVVYAPGRWFFIMAIIRSIPAAIFNKMNF